MSPFYREIALSHFILPMVFVILVPQGAEYQAVSQGVRSQKNPPQVIPIPAGKAAIRDLDRVSKTSEILVMGLCGSLSPDFEIGSIALYQSCVNLAGMVKECDSAFTDRLQNQFQVSPILGLTSDRVICSANEKRNLAKSSGAVVVDMEGFPILEQRSIAMLRVVSDDLSGDLPDLGTAINSNGKIQAIPMAIAMIKRPIGASRLIWGSLSGLRKLRQLAAELSQ
ncbi:phosphorylase [Leptolyngbya sp. AN03gr2]|uniref:phosphorylase n=1 Tax=unclassified Leptolyngbya TaxID=2650499 RepID=UPI003D30FB34